MILLRAKVTLVTLLFFRLYCALWAIWWSKDLWLIVTLRLCYLDLAVCVRRESLNDWIIEESCWIVEEVWPEEEIETELSWLWLTNWLMVSCPSLFISIYILDCSLWIERVLWESIWAVNDSDLIEVTPAEEIVISLPSLYVTKLDPSAIFKVLLPSLFWNSIPSSVICWLIAIFCYIFSNILLIWLIISCICFYNDSIKC